MDTALARSLADLGMDTRSARALALLPLVQVAWADGAVQEPERRRILDLAERRFEVGEEGLLLVRDWLRHAPSAAYFRRGGQALVALVEASPEPGLGPSALAELVEHAREVARAAGGVWGVGSVTRSEDQALRAIARRLLEPAREPPHEDPGPSPFQARRSRATVALPDPLPPPPAEGVEGWIEVPADLGGGRLPVDRRGALLGSGPEADLRVSSDPGVATLHCRFFARQGRCYVADLDTATGTFVGGERIGERRLLGGEAIRAGEIELLFRLGA